MLFFKFTGLCYAINCYIKRFFLETEKCRFVMRLTELSVMSIEHECFAAFDISSMIQFLSIYKEHKKQISVASILVEH